MTLTDDELENLAQQVIDTSLPAPDDGDGYSFHHDELIAFARAVEAAEREACAAECERMVMYPGGRQEAPAHNGVWEAARAIRMRSNA